MVSILKSLVKVTACKPEVDEERQVYLGRLTRAANELEQSVWDKLPEEVQEWANEAIKAVKAEVEIVDPEIEKEEIVEAEEPVEDDVDDDVDEEAEDDEQDEKSVKVKKSTKKVAKPTKKVIKSKSDQGLDKKEDRTFFGGRLGTKRAVLDACFVKGGTLEKIAARCSDKSFKMGTFRAHGRFLLAKGLITEVGGVYSVK